MNASLQRAWTNGLLTERRRCSLTGRSERQAELEICGPLLKSARGGRCTRRGPDRVRAEPRGRADAPDAGPTHCGLPGSPQLPTSFSWCSGAWLFTGKSREDSHPNPQGRLGSGEQALRADLCSAPVRWARSDLLPPGRTWGCLGLRASSSRDGT